jgi:4-diphosphocytidyl-2-C-methyl-D-erythritol kinase
MRSDADTATLGELPAAADNTVTRALELLRRVAGAPLGAQVWLRKRIPSAAGLGGGSSDAAAALLAANLAWNLDWPQARLVELAAQLGSDVPFFLGDSRGRPAAAICRGRGERIEHVSGLGSAWFVLVRPPEGLSTKAVYSACRPGSPSCSAQPLVNALRGGDWRQVRLNLLNRLEVAAAGLSQWIERLRDQFARLDCVAAQMSGSGSSYFGICRNLRQARAVARQLQARSMGRVFVARSC